MTSLSSQGALQIFLEEQDTTNLPLQLNCLASLFVSKNNEVNWKTCILAVLEHSKHSQGDLSWTIYVHGDCRTILLTRSHVQPLTHP